MRTDSNRDFDATKLNHHRLIEMVSEEKILIETSEGAHPIDVRPPECPSPFALCYRCPFMASIYMVIEWPIFQFHGFVCIVSFVRIAFMYTFFLSSVFLHRRIQLQH